MEITIRPFNMNDLDDVVELRSMPLAQSGTLQLPYTSPDAIRQRLDNISPYRHVLVAQVDPPGKVVGLINMSQMTTPRRAHAAELGLSVHDHYHNKGIGSRLMAAVIELADDWLNLQRLELTVFTDNPAAIHMYDKFGFKQEGLLRKYAYRHGQFVDAWQMARLKD
jgi:putative acetyltransferase